jgi:hypothetical protein
MSSCFGEYSFKGSFQDDDVSSMDYSPHEEFEEDLFGNSIIIPMENAMELHSTFVPFGSNAICTNVDMLAQVELLKLLKDMRAPLYAYDSIMQWATNAALQGHVFQHGFRSRDCVIDDLI